MTRLRRYFDSNTIAPPPGDLVARINMLLDGYPPNGAGVWARSAAKRLREAAAEIEKLRAELSAAREGR